MVDVLSGGRLVCWGVRPRGGAILATKFEGYPDRRGGEARPLER